MVVDQRARGCGEHHKFRFGDLSVKTNSEGLEYVEFLAERGTKTRTGETEKSIMPTPGSLSPRCGLHQSIKKGTQ